jgi:two-component system, NarL family, response regulator LiaR
MLSRSEDHELGLLGLRAGAAGYLSKEISLDALPRAVQGAHAGEAVISGHLSMRLIEHLRSVPEGGIGIRPVRSPLTPREWEVLDLLCAERGTEEIADELVLSVETIRSHIKNIMRKLGVRSRQEAIDLAEQLREPSRLAA